MTILKSIIQQLEHYKSLGERAISQVDEAGLHWRPDAGSNNISILVGHMSGNMLSRFTNFLTEDGEKPWRNRDREFIDHLHSREDILQAWNRGWERVLSTLTALEESQLEDLVYIRTEGHKVIETLHRQLSHYSYHVGQIVTLARTIAGEKWVSLSIAPGQSEQFNASKFSQQKQR